MSIGKAHPKREALRRGHLLRVKSNRAGVPNSYFVVTKAATKSLDQEPGPFSGMITVTLYGTNFKNYDGKNIRLAAFPSSSDPSPEAELIGTIEQPTEQVPADMLELLRKAFADPHFQ